ncbi:hypothetical protein BLOT_004649, partial [Blomia tropicalis]
NCSSIKLKVVGWMPPVLNMSNYKIGRIKLECFLITKNAHQSQPIGNYCVNAKFVNLFQPKGFIVCMSGNSFPSAADQSLTIEKRYKLW